jgi:IPT/TIG domain-containing protein
VPGFPKLTKPPQPPAGSATGGTLVTLTGTLLQNVNAVTFNGVPATAVKAVNPTQVTCVNPPGQGTASVIALDDQGNPSNSEKFTYVDPPA